MAADAHSIEYQQNVLESFNDNDTFLIGPRQWRDLVASVDAGHILAEYVGPTTVTVGGAGTFYPNPATLVAVSYKNFDLVNNVGTDDQIQFTATGDVLVDVHVSVELESASAAQELEVQILKDPGGDDEALSSCRQYLAVASKPLVFPLFWTLFLSDGGVTDFSIQIANQSGANNFTINRYSVLARARWVSGTQTGAV